MNTPFVNDGEGEGEQKEGRDARGVTEKRVEEIRRRVFRKGRENKGEK